MTIEQRGTGGSRRTALSDEDRRDPRARTDATVFLGMSEVRQDPSGRMRWPFWSGRSLAHRAAAIVFVAWGASLLTFGLLSLLPGNAAQTQLGPTASSSQVQALATRLDLNASFLSRYIHWLGGILRGDLGKSLANGQSVLSILEQRAPVSFELAGLAVIVALAIAIPVAMLAALRPNGVVDRAAMLLSVAVASTAPFVLALGLVWVFSVDLGWLPAIGFVALDHSPTGNLESLVLPVLAISLPLCGGYVRVLRGDLVAQMNAESYVLTARAVGASRWRVLVRHALRNSMFGLVTVVGLNLGVLIGATIVVEQIFGLPGLGSALVQAVNGRDTPVTEGIVLLSAVTVVIANALTDLAYGALDPRIRHASAAR